MEDSTVFIILIAFLINIWIMYEIIKSATKSNKIELHLKMHTLFLAKMAQKQGVTDQEISDILNIK